MRHPSPDDDEPAQITLQILGWLLALVDDDFAEYWRSEIDAGPGEHNTEADLDVLRANLGRLGWSQACIAQALEGEIDILLAHEIRNIEAWVIDFCQSIGPSRSRQSPSLLSWPEEAPPER